MIITKAKSNYVRYPLPEPLYPAWTPGIPQKNAEVSIVKIYTDEGIVGIAGGIDIDGIVTKTINSFIAPFLINKDPFSVFKDLERVLKFASFIGPRVYIVEIALWDLIGKYYKAPISKLLGRYRDKVTAYASTAEVRNVNSRIRYVEKIVEDGFKAVKIRAHSLNPEDDVKVVKEVRDRFNNIKIMVDANQAWSWMGQIWSYTTALKVAKELEKLEVEWLEEPLLKDDLDELVRLRKEVNIPIAGGELEHGLPRFRELIDKDAYDILQPDITLSGGVNEVRKICALAESKNKLCIPHTWTNGLGLAISLQVVATLQNCPYLEFPYEPPAWDITVRDYLLSEPIRIEKDGYVKIPEKPGIGFEVNEELVEKYTIE